MPSCSQTLHRIQIIQQHVSRFTFHVSRFTRLCYNTPMPPFRFIDLPTPKAGAAAPGDAETAGRRRTDSIRRDPVKKVGTRLTQDVRWSEITDADLAAWFDGLDA